MPATPSLNFKFLSKINSVIVDLAGFAELYAFTDPNSALVKTRQIGELLVKQIYAKQGRSFDPESRQVDLINDLWQMGLVPDKISQMLHEVRKKGNDAVHEIHGDRNEALFQLRTVHRIAVWLYKTFFDRHYKAALFSPPPEPVDASEGLLVELERLKTEFAKNEATRQKLAESVVSEAELRVKAEADAKQAYEELETAIQLGEEDNARLTAKIAEYESKLVAESKSAYVTTAQVEAVIETAAAVEKEVITEADTREIIDRQLAATGWTVDSKTIRYAKGSRPQKGKNIAIAEWPTDSGPADYVLFIGLMPVAVVEAKKQTVDVAGAIGQAKRYSRDYVFKSDEVSPGGPWRKYKIPFLFSTNGRPFLKQLKTKSGIWFLDTRREANHPRALVSWYKPLGLKQLLSQDVAEAEQQLESESSDYLPLRYYQRDAVQAVEDAIKSGQREMLVAMATGTGKTRTCIGICYRLIKAKRFRRILFLVDRTSLGQQTADSFKDLRLENNQTFTDIYDVKELGDVEPDADTKFQIATIQSMVYRLFNDDSDSGLSVDQYDCIVVDECHRGYNLDQELSENELRFRDEADYISKYSRVIEYFDAVKIGLTATPAIHTIEIFGGESQLPVYQYSYRQAVLDGFLVDHEPPLRIRTELSEGGIKWEVNEEVTVYNTKTQQLQLFKTPDEIELEIDSFNKRVVNENFNRVICEEIAKHIDPDLPGKTLVFCVTDSHADMVVNGLKNAFDDRYGSVPDDAIRKITGKADKPLQLIRLYKNEALPSIAVTVDLLTTGIDVPSIANLVFLRRVRSRILYEQMIGRGTRLCEDLYGPNDDKDCFRIFDCVDLYTALENFTDMKPVVNKANITFSQLIDELAKTTNEEDQQVIKDQLIAKLQRKKRSLKGENGKTFEDKSGTKPDSLVTQLKNATPAAISEWFSDKTNLVEFLDNVTTGGGATIMISEHADEVTSVATGFGPGNKRPIDYLEEFRTYVSENQDKVEGLKLCATRPRDLTRKSLRELQLELDKKGFSETRLRVAWRETKNVEIAATIIGYVRNAILDTPLKPFEERVNDAMKEILASQSWTKPQRSWLQRIGKQFKENTLVDRQSIDEGVFKEKGGFDRLNKVFDGKLADLLGQITDRIWSSAA